ncbi:hypothetical protein NP493_382g02065 [Ridgeia piscesae]|uniref:FYVE-type domain-containing protein n=1 Tax=Ridgeia piscesae TaxID=27915 RepID=A0AAD9L2F6_RIDPI|nr:hypothetical protein NP493_382g02065 [Ridgeia piscesae]
MPGQCYSCTTSFGVFKKEHGCKNCGFAFCGNCLREKIAVPRHNNQVHRVCVKCFKILSGTVKPDTGRMSPPRALRQMAGQESGRTHQAKPIPSCQEMERRLAALKTGEGKPVPTEAEMAAKLARLKGQNPESASAKPRNPTQFPRGTQQEEVDDLLTEISAEVDIDSRGITEGRTNNPNVENNLNKWNSPKATDYVKNIPTDDPSVQSASSGPDWQEVNQLISVPGRHDTNVMGDSEEEDDEEATKRLIRQLLEERLLDQRVAATTGQAAACNTTHTKCPADSHTETSKRESPLVCNDLPWCCICNADATLVCCGCDSDLYCQRCFKTKPYKTSPTPDSYDSSDDNVDNW